MYSSLITYRALTQPTASALIDVGGQVSYGQFNRAINQVAAALMELVPEKSSLIGVDVQDLERHWLLTAALARLGHASFTAPKSTSLVERTGATLVLSDQVDAEFAAVSARTLSNDWWTEISATEVPPVAERGEWDAPARLVITSGTTGLPKMVMLTHRHVLGRIHSILLMRPSGQNSQPARQLITMGVATVGGFTAPLAIWAAGGAMVVPDSSDVTAQVLREGITAAGVSTGQLQSLIRSLPADFQPRPELTLYTGGSRLTRALADEASRRLTPNILTIYGSTEAGSVAGAPVTAIQTELGDAGVLHPTSFVQVVDEQDQEVSAGTVGIIRVRTEAAVSEYYADPEATAQAFRDGWFYPGDVGSLSAHGVLRVIGRTSDVLNLGGHKVAPELVEDIVRSYAEVRDVGAFAVPSPLGVDELWVAIVRSEGFDQAAFEDSIRGRINGRFGTAIVTEIPRNEMGKVQRHLLRQSVMQARDRRIH